MKRIIVATLLVVWALLLGDRAHAQITNLACNNAVAINAQGAATVKAVADPAGNARVFVCGWNLNAGAAASSFQFHGGTGATCAVATVTLTGTYNLAINGSNTDSSPVARGTVTAPGSGLCLVVTGVGPLNGVIYYAQQ